MRPVVTRGRNLVLSGYIGPQQAAVGRSVAARLEMPLVDIDTRLEARHALTGDEIRARFGEARLKTLEEEAMEEALLQRAAVIRVNGFRLAQGEWLRRFQETGLVICLVAGIDAVLHSLHQALGARYHDADERAVALGQMQRDWALRGRAGVLELDTSDMQVEDIVTTVIRLRDQARAREGWR